MNLQVIIGVGSLAEEGVKEDLDLIDGEDEALSSGDLGIAARGRAVDRVFGDNAVVKAVQIETSSGPIDLYVFWFHDIKSVRRVSGRERCKRAHGLASCGLVQVEKTVVPVDRN